MNSLNFCKYWVFFIFLSLFSCRKEEPVTIKHIEINSQSYMGGYPAVWFSPQNGVVKEVGIEEQVDVKIGFETEWNCWIEPREPELKVFRSSEAKNEGIVFLGMGDAYFTKDSIQNTSNYKHRLIGENAFKAGAVFLINTSKGKSLLKITSFDKENEVLAFDWKKVQ